MKKLFFALVLVGFASVGFAQTNVATTQGKTELMSSKTSGEYQFTLPSNVTEEMVEKNAGYYTSYFTVGFDNASKKANISMVDNSEKSRYVIARFLSACGVNEVAVDDSKLKIHEFLDGYLK